MTPAQQQSMQDALVSFVEQAEQKYRAGQAEHGGNLWERENLLKDVNQEIIDQMFYHHAIKHKVDGVIDILDSAMAIIRKHLSHPGPSDMAAITEKVMKAKIKLQTL